jgi:hypothetical protein
LLRAGFLHLQEEGRRRRSPARLLERTALVAGAHTAIAAGLFPIPLSLVAWRCHFWGGLKSNKDGGGNIDEDECLEILYRRYGKRAMEKLQDKLLKMFGRELDYGMNRRRRSC